METLKITSNISAHKWNSMPMMINALKVRAGAWKWQSVTISVPRSTQCRSMQHKAPGRKAQEIAQRVLQRVMMGSPASPPVCWQNRQEPSKVLNDVLFPRPN